MDMEKNRSRDLFIKAVRDASDFEGTAASYDRIVHQGLRAFAPCPNHDDRAPSLSIDHGQQVGRCWMCLAEGDVFWLVMSHEGLCFRDAVRTLAARAGILEPNDVQWTTEDVGNPTPIQVGPWPVMMRTLEVPRRLRV